MKKEEIEKRLFDTIYQWGKTGIVVDEKSEFYRALLTEIEEESLSTIVKEFSALIEKWKKDIGEIPENTCPSIDKCIKVIDSFVKDTEYLRKNAYKYDSVEELAKDIPDLGWNSPSDDLDQKLRKDNEKLRELGIYWYEKCKELVELLAQQKLI
jgi:hypothetical protein